jgi:hypothetical protein
MMKPSAEMQNKIYYLLAYGKPANLYATVQVFCIFMKKEAEYFFQKFGNY